MKLKDFYSKQIIELNDDINMYVCGPTVYDDPHIGNMRPIIIFDILNRVASLKSKVTFIHNITDVDDKIIAKAIEQGVSESEISETYTQKYLDLLDKLNIVKPTHMPIVTSNIDGIIEFISELIKNGDAYESNGSVYFSVKGFTNYGKLMESQLDDLVDNEVNEDKRDSKDFALWKQTVDGIKWDSPWGKGRPGWHTECAYFINKYFGSNGLDIHGGGIDLKFPHHINEMAQYESCCEVEQTSKVWSYVGHINLGDEKMSKSLGNIISAEDFINEHGAMTLRMIMLQTSMLNPMSLTDDAITNAKNIITKIINALVKSLINLAIETDVELNEVSPSSEFVSILENDLDVVNSLTFILEQVKKINSGIVGNEQTLMELISNLNLIGFEFENNYNQLRTEIKKAKQESNFELLDKLRKEVIK